MSDQPRKLTLLRNVMLSGIRTPLDTDDEVRLFFLNSTLIMGGLILLIFAVRDLFADHLLLGGITLSAALIVLGVFITLRVTKSYRLGTVFIPSLFFIFFTYLTVSGGSGSSGVLWMEAYSVVAIFMLGFRVGGILALAFLAINAAALFVPGFGPPDLSVEFKARIIGAYVVIMVFSLAFENIRRSAQDQVTEAAAKLLAEKKQTDSIMTNVQEGIFLLNKHLQYEPQYSRVLEKYLELENLTGRPFVDSLRGKLSEKPLTATIDYLEMFFADHPNLELLAEINPIDKAALVFDLAGQEPREKFLEFSFALIVQEDGSSRILGTVRDTTEAVQLGRKLKEEEDRTARQMKNLFQIIHVKPEMMEQFLEDAQEEIESVNNLLKSKERDPETILNFIYQGVHAVKGNAILLGLGNFSNRAHGLEDKIARMREKAFSWDYLLEITVELSLLQNELHEIKDLIDRMSGFQRDMAASQSHDDLLVLTLQKAVDKAAQENGRQATLSAEDFHSEDVPMDRRKLVKDVLIQLVRNSLAHGIESAEQRIAAGKAEQGLISLHTERRDGQLVIHYRDDGQGLVLDKIRHHARNLPAFKSLDIDAMTDQKILGLVFHPGFSTAETTTLTAGRGMGMSLVKTRVESAGGVLKVKNAPGKSLAFEILLPA